jgi:alpha-beta hydrolase superfamily lysophospholipase
VITGSFEDAAGTRLRTVVWPAGTPRGRILVVHGLGEHSGRFSLLARALRDRGYSVFLYDQRGHGRSEGRRAYVSGFDRFVEDLALAAAAAERALEGPGTLFLYGHSMGALVLIRFLQTHRPRTPGVVLSAPWLGTRVPVPRWKELSAAVLRRVAPAVRVPTAVAPEQLTADPEMQRAYLDDPLVGHGISVALYDAVLDAQRLCAEDAMPALPVLLLLPLDDSLVDIDRTREWASGLGRWVETAELPGTRHEPHNDVGRKALFGKVADWLDDRTPGARSG